MTAMPTATRSPALARPSSYDRGADVLAAALGAAHPVLDLLPTAIAPGSVPLVRLTAPAPMASVDGLHRHLSTGGRAVVLIGPAAVATLEDLVPGSAPAVGHGPLTVVDADDPLVYDTRLVASGRSACAGWSLAADDLMAIDVDGDPWFEVGGAPVAVEARVGEGTLVVIGSAALLDDHWITAADNLDLLQWALTGVVDPAVTAAVHGHRQHEPVPHAPVPQVESPGEQALLDAVPPAAVAVLDAAFLTAAARAGRLLSPAVHDTLVDLVDRGTDAGALLLRGLPVGQVPATPASPTATTTKDHVSEMVLLTVARRLGQPVGYAPEHGGRIVQDLLPTRTHADRQTSTSSNVTLEFHTETAFHRHKPRFLLLLCLRGDPAALTLLCSVRQVLDRLPLAVRRVLFERRFRTAVDESFTAERSARLGRPMAVLAGDPRHPTCTFDADLMVGVDDEATAALVVLRQVIEEAHIAVALEPGDLLVVDNAVCVHGRSPFRARFDGTDRWLQRTFVVTDLAASATERDGRVITTRFTR